MPGGDYRTALRDRAGWVPEAGPLIDADGSAVGQHRGAAGYTVGQRQGLGVALGEPRYVSRIDPLTNTITLARRQDLETHDVPLEQVTFVDGTPPARVRQPVPGRGADPSSRAAGSGHRCAGGISRAGPWRPMDRPYRRTGLGRRPRPGLRALRRRPRPRRRTDRPPRRRTVTRAPRRHGRDGRVIPGPDLILAGLVGLLLDGRLRPGPRDRRRPDPAAVARRGARRVGRRRRRRAPRHRRLPHRRLLPGDRVDRRLDRHWSHGRGGNPGPGEEQGVTRGRRAGGTDVGRGDSDAAGAPMGTFLRGLTIGALVGAAIAGSAIWRRIRRGKDAE